MVLDILALKPIYMALGVANSQQNFSLKILASLKAYVNKSIDFRVVTYGVFTDSSFE